MPIQIASGIPGSGKSTWLADRSLFLLKRNKRYFKKSGIRRLVVSNLKFSKKVEKEFEGFLEYWTDTAQLVKKRDCDIIFDEVATYLDSTQWERVPLEFKRWLQLHRHFGIEIYGTTQDFPMIDISMRRLVKRLYLAIKIIGSRDISATRPPIKNPWGVIFLREVARESFIKDQVEYKYTSIFPEILFISKGLVGAFDTTQELEPGKYPPLQHITRHCEVCGKDHITHR